jgi:membrane-associated phospholipid phosphatase
LLELLVTAALSIAVGVLWGLVVRAAPRADPARAAARHVETGLAAHPRRRGFIAARLDRETATGLGLTLALLAVAVVGVIVGVVVAMIRHQSGVVNIDRAVTSWAAAHATDLSLSALSILTWAGSTLVVIGVALAAAVYGVRRWRSGSIFAFLFLVVAGQSLLSNAIKVAVARVRPDAPPFHVVQGPSFPSGHSMAAAATWAAVALVLGRGASVRTRAVLAGTAAGIAVMVACSRVFLGAHWTSDAIGGVLIGWTWFAVCAVAFGGHLLRLGQPVEAATDRRTSVQAPARSRSPAASP